MALTIRYRTVCHACGVLKGTWRSKDDAIGRGLGHREAQTPRVWVTDPLDPAHAYRLEYRMSDSLVWRDSETGEPASRKQLT